jgi:hypothetical protein
VFTILPAIEDVDTTCPEDTTANSRDNPGYQAHPPVRPSGPPGRGRHYHVAEPAQWDPRSGGTGITQISYGSDGAASITRASPSPTAISSNTASLTRSRPIPWPPRTSPARPARRAFRPSRSLSPPWAIRQAGMCGRRCYPPNPGQEPNNQAHERPVRSGQLSRARLGGTERPFGCGSGGVSADRGLAPARRDCARYLGRHQSLNATPPICQPAARTEAAQQEDAALTSPGRMLRGRAAHGG